MPERSEHDEGKSSQPDAEEKKVALMSIRLPILILLGVLLMFAMGVLATQMR
jgi:hypothetical protein